MKVPHCVPTWDTSVSRCLEFKNFLPREFRFDGRRDKMKACPRSIRDETRTAARLRQTKVKENVSTFSTREKHSGKTCHPEEAREKSLLGENVATCSKQKKILEENVATWMNQQRGKDTRGKRSYFKENQREKFARGNRCHLE